MGHEALEVTQRAGGASQNGRSKAGHEGQRQSPLSTWAALRRPLEHTGHGQR